MHGAGRVVLVDVKVEIGAATGWATGGFSVKQRDFGMRPFRGGPGGSVKVADRVTFDFEAGGGGGGTPRAGGALITATPRRSGTLRPVRCQGGGWRSRRSWRARSTKRSGASSPTRS